MKGCESSAIPGCRDILPCLRNKAHTKEQKKKKTTLQLIIVLF